MLSNTDLLAHGFILLFIAIWLITPVQRLSYLLIVALFTALVCTIVAAYALTAFSPPKWPLIYWSIIAVAASLFKAWRCYRQQPDFSFNDNELQLYQRFFSDLTPGNYHQLIRCAVWREMDSGQTLLTKGEEVVMLSLVFEGKARVNIGNDKHVYIAEGQFIGEMSYVSGNSASMTVVIAEKSLLVEWPQNELKTLASQNFQLGNCIQAHFNRDLKKKLE